jgi:putative transposase
MTEKGNTEKPGGAGFLSCAGKEELCISRRRLPHWQLATSTYFVTFRLKSGVIFEDERKIILNAIKYFHNVRYWVTVAVVMPDHIHLILKPFVVESDIEYSLSRILQSIKGFSAREINKARGTKGTL